MRKHLILLVSCFVLTAYTLYAVLDTFVIARAYAPAQTEVTGTTVATATVSGSSYSDGSITICISTYRVSGTSVYVADITLSDISQLAAVFANGTYGRNITAKTSATAASANAILAINGDYYGARQSGYVIRNGILYRSTKASDSQEDLVIYRDGAFAIVTEGSASAQSLLDSGAYQVFSFGPGLIADGEVTVSAESEVGQSMASNPRTAIAQISGLHYLFVVSDGRTSASAGLSLSELAGFLKSLGAVTAYNLDGGGSSTMVFNGAIINQPTTNGNKITERSVSDIVAILS